MNRIGISVSAIFLATSVSFAQDSQSTYDVQTFFTGATVKRLTIHTPDGQLISTLEVPVGVYLSIYADQYDDGAIGAKERSPFDPTSKKIATQYSGRISIRTQLAKNIKDGRPDSESMIDVPLRLDLRNAIVKVTQD